MGIMKGKKHQQHFNNVEYFPKGHTVPINNQMNAEFAVF